MVPPETLLEKQSTRAAAGTPRAARRVEGERCKDHTVEGDQDGGGAPYPEPHGRLARRRPPKPSMARDLAAKRLFWQPLSSTVLQGLTRSPASSKLTDTVQSSSSVRACTVRKSIARPEPAEVRRLAMTAVWANDA